MSSSMTWPAYGDPVTGFVPQFWCLRPRLQMMNVEAPAALAAINARPIVSREHGIAERDVLRVAEISVTQCRSAAFPVRVSRAVQMLMVVGRTYPRRPDAAPDRCLMVFGEHPSPERFRDVGALRWRGDAPRRGRLPNSGCADLSPYIGTLRRVVVKVGPPHATSVRAEPLTAPGDGVAALLAESRHKTEFTTWN